MREIWADVVIVGFGGSGATAAIEACDAGASVVVLEKAEEGGGSSRESGGSLRTVVDVDKAAQHFYELTTGATPLSMMKTFAQGLVDMPGWLAKNGGDTAPSTTLNKTQRKVLFPYPAPTTAFPGFSGSEGVGGRLRVRGEGGDGGGFSLWATLYAACEKRPIKVLYNTSGIRLIRDPKTGILAGVLAGGPDGEVTVKANRGIILTCGGFNYNPEMHRQYLGVEMPALSPPGRNTGDGIKMAMDVGADLWHMGAVAASLGYKIDGFEAAFSCKVSGKSFFVVDQHGRRFVNETAVEGHSGMLATGAIDPIEGRRIRMPSFLIFDDELRKGDPIVTTRRSSYNQRFPWSKDNSEEVKKGWIKTATNFADLAKQLGLPPDALEAAARRYNEGVTAGKDEFGRKPELMLRVEKGPFYGIPLWPTLLNTQGGPRRNERAQIVDVYGKAIPRLYSAGELGSIWSHLYPGAGNVCEAIVFGRIAGQNAAKDKPLN
jgi:succinate dehydrogenase/fumarate reductase flavoprotein subunit